MFKTHDGFSQVVLLDLPYNYNENCNENYILWLTMKNFYSL